MESRRRTNILTNTEYRTLWQMRLINEDLCNFIPRDMQPFPAVWQSSGQWRRLRCSFGQ